MVGIKDVAKRAGVSISTVSNALNGKKNVGDLTRIKILQICDEMSYVPNFAGKSLKSGESNTILFNFSDFDRSFYLKIINGISDYANENDFDLIICTRKSCQKYMNNKMTKGAIILDEKMTDEALVKVARENYPVIVLDRMLNNNYIKSIVVNNYGAMSELVQGLVERGDRRFGFIGGIQHTPDAMERFEAFTDVLEKNNIPFYRKNYISGDYRERSGYKAAKIFMLSEEKLDVLVCANDNMAIGAIKALRENGYRVPEDIGVTGFDDCGMAKIMGLTTVAVPNYERGYLAARYLIESLNLLNNMETLKISASVKWRSSVL